MAYFQYVGDGIEPPIEIKLFGKYSFEFNGDSVEITDKADLAKIKEMPTFIETTKTGEPKDPEIKAKKKEEQKKERERRAAMAKRAAAQKAKWDKMIDAGPGGEDLSDEAGAVDLGD